jgi:hypothetical protein
MPMNEHSVFISYSRSNIDFMRRLRDDLTAAGIAIWTDENLTPGASSWKDAIEAALNNSESVIVLMSPEAKKSEWVEREIDYARLLNRRIIPVLIAGDATSAIPFELINAQLVDMRTRYPRALQKLIETLQTNPAPQPADTQNSSPLSQSHVSDSQTGERILTKVAANLMRGAEGVGGHLTVTDRQLRFEAHRLNLQREPEAILLTDIVEVKPINNLGIVPNGMLVTTKSGKQFRFVVWGRNALIALIKSQL